jgi:hypothetical protein
MNKLSKENQMYINELLKKSWRQIIQSNNLKNKNVSLIHWMKLITDKFSLISNQEK